ncbi:hypothetical protein C8J57DRAFT_1512036 [Mycena rebaudengoi]|nr:hypothetical protein C8J57DRAFT_1512036 [Mycena rebaudengoi]
MLLWYRVPLQQQLKAAAREGEEGARKAPSALGESPPLFVDSVTSVEKCSTRPARSRKASGKVAENLERDAESKDAQIEKLKKQLKSLSQKHEKTKHDIRERDAERTPPESEEEDEDDTVQMSSFSASIVSKGTVGHTGQKTAPKKLRKSGEAPIATPMARIPLADRATANT